MTTVTLTLPANVEDTQVSEITRSTSGYWTQLDVQTRIGLSAEGVTGTIWLPYAPREVTYEGFGSEWSELQRDGDREPLLVPSGKRLKRMSFTVELTRPEWNESVQSVLDQLEEFAATKRRVYVHYSEWENGFWRLLNMRVVSSMRSDHDNSISRATIDLDFSRSSDAVRTISPVTGGTSTGNGSGGGTSNNNGSKNIPRYYRTKKGDTLHSIAIKFYGTHKAWRKIARLNKIKRVRRRFPAGRRLRLR